LGFKAVVGTRQRDFWYVVFPAHIFLDAIGGKAVNEEASPNDAVFYLPLEHLGGSMAVVKRLWRVQAQQPYSAMQKG
jgi:hypothetical protein